MTTSEQMSTASTDGPKQRSAAPLYRKLRPRPNGPSRAEVSANQRARLHGAMVEAISLRGYTKTSVAQLCRLAGISKRTFYEQFENKEACFIASYERVLARVAARVTEQSMREKGWTCQLASGLEALIREIANQPKAGRLVLLEADAVGSTVRLRHAGLRAEFERIVAAGFARELPERSFPVLLARGIVCGLERAICHALREGEGLEEPAKLAAELARWASSHGGALRSLSHVKAIAVEGTTRPPARDVRRAGHRARILRAAAELAIIDGPERPSMARISHRAGVDTDTLSRYYGSPEACLREAMDLLSLEALTCVSDASRGAGDGLSGACLGIMALARRLARDQLMRGVLFPAPALAALPAVERGEQVLGGVLDILLARVPEVGERSTVARTATVGALSSVIIHHVACDEAHTLAGSGAYAAYLALAPFVDGQALSSALDGLVTNTLGERPSEPLTGSD
jgi:AcrR family transcriptional regulator